MLGFGRVLTFGIDGIKKEFRVVQIIIMILNALLFTFSSIFTAVALYSTWGHTNLSYVLLALFLVDIVLYLVAYIFSCMRAKPNGVKDFISGLKIARKGMRMIYVVFSLIMAFATYDNNAISLAAKVAMTWFSLSMAITYIIAQLLIIFIRRKSKKIISKVKEVKGEVYERVAKIKNKRSS